ncbi:MAG: hypothetical protein ACJAW1_001880 [Glaciecola sp.]|jgi:hypothetical protein
MKVSTQQFKLKRLVLITGLVFGMAACNTDDLAPPPPPPFVNTAPEVATTAPLSANEGQVYSYRFSATDLDADPLSYSASDSVWLSMDAATGVLSGTPGSGDVGENAVTLTVTDGTDSTTQSFTITVIAALADNVAPTFTSTPVETGAVDEDYSYTATANDLNFDDVSFVFSGTLPAWATFTTDTDTDSATLTGTPDVAGDYPVEITISDGTEDVVQTFTIVVTGPAVVTTELVVFENAALPEWALWTDNGGPFDVVTVVDDPDRDQAAQFSLTKASVAGFTARDSAGAVGGMPFDASGFVANGQVVFELLLLEETTVPVSSWFFKIEAGSNASSIEVPLSTSIEAHASPELNTWQTYTFPLAGLVSGGSLDASLIDLFMVFPSYGDAAGAVYLIDNFQLVSVVGGEDNGDGNDNPELLTNGDFESGLASWKADTGSVLLDGTNNIFEANIETLPANVFDVNQSQVLPLTEGTSYTLSFRAKASKSRTMLAGIGLNQDPWTNTTEEPALTTEWQDFTYDIVANFGNDNSRVIFDMGGDTGMVNIDDVSLKVTAEAVVPVDTLLTNGDFENGLESWKLDTGAVVLEGANSIFEANIETLPANVFDVNQSQVLPLTEGVTYKLSFRAKASKARTMLAGIGLNQDPWTNTTQEPALTTEWQDFSYDILANFGNDNSRVIFDMGGDTGVVNIDDVTLSVVVVE